QTHGFSVTNYAGSEGYHWWPTAHIGPGGRPGLSTLGDYAGLFAPTRTNGLRDVTDGTSNTIAVCEVDSYSYCCGSWDAGGSGRRRLRGGESVTRTPLVFLAHTGIVGNEGGQLYQEVDGGNHAPNTWFRAGPNMYCPTYITAAAVQSEWVTASSTHGGGIVQFARCDGSVSGVNKNLQIGVWIIINGIQDNAPNPQPSAAGQ
ncbi:MAG: DUF1559 domain-containing protein, partial [Pirellulales bacterium]